MKRFLCNVGNNCGEVFFPTDECSLESCLSGDDQRLLDGLRAQGRKVFVEYCYRGGVLDTLMFSIFEEVD